MSILRHLTSLEAEKHRILLKKVEEISQAPCTDYADEFFFDDGTDVTSQAAQSIARSICDKCPISKECLEYALAARIQYGMWGGQTAEERKTLLRAMKAQPKVNPTNQ